MGYEVDSFGRNAHDPYIDDGVEDLDDREAAGYYDGLDGTDHDYAGDEDYEVRDGWDDHDPDPDFHYNEHFDTREEVNGER